MMDYNIRITDSSSIDSQNNTGGGRVTSAAELMFAGGARPPIMKRQPWASHYRS
jgi:hypothetical protein